MSKICIYKDKALRQYATTVLRHYGIKEEKEESKKNSKIRKISKVSGATFISDVFFSQIAKCNYLPVIEGCNEE